MKKLIKWVRSLFRRPIILKAGIVRHIDTSKFKEGDLLYVGQDGKLTNNEPEWIKEKTYCQDPITKKIYSSVFLGAWKTDGEDLIIASENDLTGCNFIKKLINKIKRMFSNANEAIDLQINGINCEKYEKYVAGEDLQDGEAIKIINGKAYKA